MKKTAITVSVIVALLLVSGATVVVANQGSGNHRAPQTCGSFTVGESLPLSTLTGHYYNVTNHRINGPANGTFTFQVSQIYADGCTLTITGGTVFIGKTSNSVTGGTVIIGGWPTMWSMESRGNGPFNGDGLGTTSSGSFVFSIYGLHGNSTKASANQVQLDLKNGASEFWVQLNHRPVSFRR